MRRDNLKIAQGNYFVQNGIIPLGINTFRGNNENKRKIVCITNKKNGSIVVVSTSGWGKSILMRRINEYKLKLFNINKPALIIDTQGVDHRLMKYANDKPYPLWRNFGEFPFSFDNTVSYTPMFASNKAMPEDKIFGITLNDLAPRDFLSSGMSVSCKDEIFKIKIQNEKNREIMDDPNLFYQEFNNIPAKISDPANSALDYPENLMHNAIKQSLLRFFSLWKGYQPTDEERPSYMSKERWNIRKMPPYFVKRKSKYHRPTFWDEWDKNRIVIDNFMDCKEREIAMSIYGGHALKDAYEYADFMKRKLKDKFKGIYVFVEEANLFIDAQDIWLEKGSNFYLTEILCRGFKFEMEATVSFQSLTGSNKHIRQYLTSGSNPIIIGNLTPADREFLSAIFPDIKKIKLRNRDELPDGLKWGACEWMIWYNDTYYDTFVPYPCMSQYHKRGN